MSTRSKTERWAALLGLSLALILAACNGDGAAPGGEGDAQPAASTDGDAAAVVDESAAGAGETAAEGDTAGADDGSTEGGAEDDGDIDGMISSGTDVAPDPIPTPKPVEIEGISRRLSMAEAAGLAPFPLYEPTFIPEDAYTVAPIIVEPREGQESADLPNVNSAYTVEGTSSSFAISQYPASATDMLDIEGEPEAVSVGGTPAERYVWQNDNRGAIIWTVGDTRIVLRGAEIAPDVLLQIAEGMQPIP